MFLVTATAPRDFEQMRAVLTFMLLILQPHQSLLRLFYNAAGALRGLLGLVRDLSRKTCSNASANLEQVSTGDFATTDRQLAGRHERSLNSV